MMKIQTASCEQRLTVIESCNKVKDDLKKKSVKDIDLIL